MSVVMDVKATSVIWFSNGASMTAPTRSSTMKTPEMATLSRTTHHHWPGRTTLSRPKGKSVARRMTAMRVKKSYWRGVGVDLIRSQAAAAVFRATTFGSRVIGSNWPTIPARTPSLRRMERVCRIEFGRFHRWSRTSYSAGESNGRRRSQIPRATQLDAQRLAEGNDAQDQLAAVGQDVVLAAAGSRRDRVLRGRYELARQDPAAGLDVPPHRPRLPPSGVGGVVAECDEDGQSRAQRTDRGDRSRHLGRPPDFLSHHHCTGDGGRVEQRPPDVAHHLLRAEVPLENHGASVSTVGV